MKIELVDADSIRPSSYNPREADPERLAMVELSIRKMGFVLPLYVDANGEILSGHQRHYVATTRLGFDLLPVVRLGRMALDKRKAVNIAFNRGTNDMAEIDTSASLSSQLLGTDLGSLSAFPDAEDRFPCMSVERVPLASLTKVNAGRWVRHAKNAARALYSSGVEMPVVARRNLWVVNGIGRLEYLAERGAESVPVVYVSDEAAAFASAMLNRLTMDFNIHERYADVLRYNSFRRSRGARKYLGRCFTFPLLGSVSSKNFDVTKEADRARWVRKFGSPVLDFGAGTLSETNILRGVGVDCVPFEPYRLDGESIDKGRSVATSREFLRRVAEGAEFRSVFVSAIFNSVPFESDRVHVMNVIRALCSPRTRLYAVSASVKQAGYRHASGASYLNKDDAGKLHFRLEYEPHTTLADFSGKPKVQKYHTLQEWYELWKRGFEIVQVSESANNCECQCAKVIPVPREDLEAAIRFEFDLPYPDGSRMGLVDEALAAFASRGAL